MHRDIRVAFIGEVSYPSHNIKWINHLVEREGIKGIVLTRYNQDSQHISQQITVIKEMLPFPYFDLLKRKRYLKRLRNILEEQEIDLIHFLWGVDDCVLGPLLNKPYLITTRGSDVFRDLSNHYLHPQIRLSKRGFSDFYKSRLHLRAYRNASAVTSTSKGQMAVLSDFYPYIKKHELVRTGVYFEELSKYGNDLPPTAEKVIFSPRTMRPIYNQDIILKAFAGLIKIYPNAQLRMVDNAEGSSWSMKIRELIKGLDLTNNVLLLPSLNKEEMYIEYERATVCVMVPKTDGVPVTGIESMAIGTPVIVGDNDYDQDIFNDETVWRLSKNSPQKLEDKLLEMFQMKEEDIKLKTASARETVLSLGDRNIEMKKVAELYKAIV